MTGEERAILVRCAETKADTLPGATIRRCRNYVLVLSYDECWRLSFSNGCVLQTKL